MDLDSGRQAPELSQMLIVLTLPAVSALIEISVRAMRENSIPIKKIICLHIFHIFLNFGVHQETK